ncbi:MAG TPA: hypothetical protein VFX16_33685 [Pseudonocardiaceae bacterium]|nr:hypothetical protein [Pseudonocardiaceae bacterium]
MRRATVTALAGVVLVLTLAGCADDQPGDQNPGAGYTNNVSDLLVKIPALQSDPCRGAQGQQDYGNCGRYVTEVANTVAALQADVPNQADAINALAASVRTYQSMACDTIPGKPSAAQRTDCPAALTSIGRDLDVIAKALASSPSSP